MSEERAGERQGAGRGVRERILDAAIATLREAGVQDLSQGQVARRAGVRQSHLTYYFPKRNDLLEAITERVVEGMAAHVRAVLDGSRDPMSALEAIANAIAQREHMRMFIGVIVEADGDTQVREILMRHTRRFQAALAELLGDDDALEQARLVLACLWGMGLYAFVAGEGGAADQSPSFLAWLERARP